MAGGEKTWVIRDRKTGRVRYRTGSFAPFERVVTLGLHRTFHIIQVFNKSAYIVVAITLSKFHIGTIVLISLTKKAN